MTRLGLTIYTVRWRVSECFKMYGAWAFPVWAIHGSGLQE